MKRIIDEVDKKIIVSLLSNPRASFREIARKIGLSTATVINRVEELKENGIFNPTLLLNFRKLNIMLALFKIEGDVDTSILEEMDDILFILKLDEKIIAGFAVRSCINSEIDILHLSKKIKAISNVKKIDVKLIKDFSIKNKISRDLLNNCSVEK